MAKAGVLAASVSDIKFRCVNQGVLVTFFLLHLGQLCAVIWNICNRHIMFRPL